MFTALKSLIKVKFYSDTNKSAYGRDYTYYTEEPLQVGDMVNVSVRDTAIKAVVTAIDVPESEIAAFRAAVKTIPAGSVIKDDQLHDRPQEAKDALSRVSEKPADESKATLFSEQPGDESAAVIDIIKTPENTAVILIHPETDPNYGALSQEVIGLCKYAEARIIKSDADVKTATDDLGLISKLVRSIEDLRAKYVKPLNDHVKVINSTFKALTEPIDKANIITRQKIQAYRAEAERIRKEAEALNAQAMEVARKQAEMNSGAFTVSIDPVAAPPQPVKTIRTETGTLSTRKIRRARVVDFAKLPDTYKLENTRLLASAASTGVKEIPGVEFYEDESLIVRGR